MAYQLAAQAIDKGTKMGSLSEIQMQVRNKAKIAEINLSDQDITYVTNGLFDLKAKLGRERLHTLNVNHEKSNVAFDTASCKFK